MSDTKLRPGPKPRPPLQDKDVQGLKYFRAFKEILGSLHEHHDGANRKLHYDQLASLVLLRFFNPVMTSLRGVQQASGLRRVQEQLGVSRTSLGSLSESSRVFDPDLLRAVVEELSGRVEAADGPQLPPGLTRELALVAVDGSVLPALARMMWAAWRNEDHRAAKVHVEFDLLRGAPRPLAVTDANGNEKEVLRQALVPGKFYIQDGGYGEYKLMEDIRSVGSSFVTRAKDNAVYETIEERELTEADREAGVQFDRVVWLGCDRSRGALTAPVRIIRVRGHVPAGRSRHRSKRAMAGPLPDGPEQYELLLVTDRMDLPAEWIALLYRLRWTIELFFRWFKCVLGFSHLLFESRNGVEILVYCALIASLLISVWTGRKPTKRTLEMVQLYFQGWAELDELEEHIARLQPATA